MILASIQHSIAEDHLQVLSALFFYLNFIRDLRSSSVVYLVNVFFPSLQTIPDMQQTTLSGPRCQTRDPIPAHSPWTAFLALAADSGSWRDSPSSYAVRLPLNTPALLFGVSAHMFTSSPLLRNDTKNPSSQLTAVSLAGLSSQSSLNKWRDSKERHEQIALGRKMIASEVEMGKWLDEMDEKIGGKGK